MLFSYGSNSNEPNQSGQTPTTTLSEGILPPLGVAVWDGEGLSDGDSGDGDAGSGKEIPSCELCSCVLCDGFQHVSSPFQFEIKTF